MSKISKVKDMYQQGKINLRQYIAQLINAYYEKMIFTTMGLSILFAGIV